VKKKYVATSKDKKDWKEFIKQIGTISAKDDDFLDQNVEINKTRKLDLHGYSLDQANKIVKKFVIQSFEKNYRKLIIVTGKGMRSKSHNDPYKSEKLSILKYSVPEFIYNDKDLRSKINKICDANIKDGGKGAIYIFLKNNKFKE
tara:strand:- start:398 stop:832 length:435 start_codon:yes stop_codon:yes gene_type:complete